MLYVPYSHGFIVTASDNSAKMLRTKCKPINNIQSHLLQALNCHTHHASIMSLEMVHASAPRRCMPHARRVVCTARNHAVMLEAVHNAHDTIRVPGHRVYRPRLVQFEHVHLALFIPDERVVVAPAHDVHFAYCNTRRYFFFIAFTIFFRFTETKFDQLLCESDGKL